MESSSPWSLEVETGKSVRVALDTEVKFVKVTGISLGKNTRVEEGNRPVYVYMKSDKRGKQLIATLYSKELRGSCMNLTMADEDLELCHTWDNGSLFLHGVIAEHYFHAKYKSPQMQMDENAGRKDPVGKMKSEGFFKISNM